VAGRRNLDAGDVVEVSGIVAIAADAVGNFSDPVRNIADLLMEALPLIGNAGAIVQLIDAFADAGDEQRLAGQETRGLRLSSRVESMTIGSRSLK
jgi:hypothetical protein